MPEQPSDWIGREFGDGRYVVLSVLGSGGMADVFRVFDRETNTEAAAKFPKAILAADSHFRKRFEREVAFLANLNHPHIVPVIDSGEHGGLPYAVFPYLPGGTLKSRLQNSDPMITGRTLSESLQWLMQIASALDFLHKNNVLHRDVKPDNIYFDLNDNAFLGDFGVIRSLHTEDGGEQHTALTSPNTVLGTCAYMSPELIMGQTPYTPGVDQYSLAVTVYEFLCGKRPFDGTPQQIMIHHLQAPPPPMHEVRPELPIALSTAVQHGLAKDAADRYPSCSEFAKTVIASANSLTPTVAEARPRELVRQMGPAFAKAPAGPRTATKQRAAAPSSRRWLLPIGVVVALVLMVGAWFAAARLWDGGSDNGSQKENEIAKKAPPVVDPPNKREPAKKPVIPKKNEKVEPKTPTPIPVEPKKKETVVPKPVEPKKKEPTPKPVEPKKKETVVPKPVEPKKKEPTPKPVEPKKKETVVPKPIPKVKKGPEKIPAPKDYTIVVSQNKPGAIQTITKAIQLSKDGDQIFVEPGVYRENIVLNKNVQLVGKGDKKNIIVESSGGSCLAIQTDKAKVQGLTLKQLASGNDKQSAVDIKQGELEMTDCDISSASGIGVSIQGPSAKPLIQKCKIHGSAIGVLAAKNAAGVIEDCDLTANSLWGAAVKSGADPIFRDCRVFGDESNTGILIDDGGKGRFQRCRLFGKFENGFEVGKAGEPDAGDCKIGHCQASGVYVHSGGRGKFVGCDIDGGGRSAVDVFDGNPTFRKCTLTNSKYIGVEIGPKGKGVFEDVEIVGASQSSIDVHGDPVFRKCTIRDGKGVGVCVFPFGRGFFDDCTVKAHAKTNVISLSTLDPYFSRCKIRDGKKHGVMIAGSGKFELCTVQDNEGHGFDIQKTFGKKRAYIWNCRVNRNSNVGVKVQGNAMAEVTDTNLARNGSATQFANKKNVNTKGNSEQLE